MAFPLRLHAITYRAEEFFADKEVRVRAGDQVTSHRYGDLIRRARRLADSLRRLGLSSGDRVGTLQWNHAEHLECYLGVPNAGFVLHTLNLRLSADDLGYVIAHGGDRVVIVDSDQLALLLDCIAPGGPVEHVIVIGDDIDTTTVDLPGVVVHAYEDFLAGGDPDAAWADVAEDAPAGLCYTSATTGRPKGVVYTHRSQFLHALAICTADALGISERDTILPVVPFFHANAWGLPYAGTWMGSTFVLPGRHPSFAHVADLIESESVTFAAGVPTVLLGILAEQDERERDFASLTRLMSGGSAVPRAVAEAFQERWDALVVQPYGMTEASPVTHVSRVRSTHATATPQTQLEQRSSQGVLLPGLEMRLVDDSANPVPRDGASPGQILLRGPWVAEEYERDERTSDAFVDGWYHTGDVATVDEHGYVRLVDRTPDLIKSGGEWISSVALENALMAHEAVREAAVVGRSDDRWGERPVAFVVPEGERPPSDAELRAHLAERFVSYWLPDEFRLIDEIPKTGVGKFSKRTLRALVTHEQATVASAGQ
jgi:fatty-acyl-CoA synthase